MLMVVGVSGLGVVEDVLVLGVDVRLAVLRVEAMVVALIGGASVVLTPTVVLGAGAVLGTAVVVLGDEAEVVLETGVVVEGAEVVRTSGKLGTVVVDIVLSVESEAAVVVSVVEVVDDEIVAADVAVVVVVVDRGLSWRTSSTSKTVSSSSRHLPVHSWTLLGSFLSRHARPPTHDTCRNLAPSPHAEEHWDQTSTSQTPHVILPHCRLSGGREKGSQLPPGNIHITFRSS